MNTKRRTLAIVLLLLTVSLACSLVQRAPTATVTPEPPPATDAPPTSTPRPTTASPTATPVPKGSELRIINETDRDIWYLLLSATDAAEWGEDLLGNEIIPAGETFTLSGLSGGTYDLQVRDEDDAVMQTIWGLEIAGVTTQIISAQAALEITNLSSVPIAQLYVSPTDSDTWGEEWLGGETIPVNATYVVEGLGPGLFDLRVDDADQQVIEAIYHVSLDSGYYWDVMGKLDLPSNAVLRFSDDFSDNRNNWGGITTAEVIHNTPSGGEYCLDILTDQLTAWEWYEPFRPDEFVAEVACRTDDLTDASCGLGFGPDDDNLYWFEVSPPDQSYALFLLLDGEWQDSLIGWTESKHIQPGGWNFLSIERLDGVFSVFINGVLQSAVESDYFPNGRIGLGGASYIDSNARVCLDDLRVWRLE
jgi:hypothetical protein